MPLDDASILECIQCLHFYQFMLFLETDPLTLLLLLYTLMYKETASLANHMRFKFKFVMAD